MNTNVDYVRQLDFFNPSDYDGKRIDIIGAGGIGSFTALAIAKLGLSKIRVWDGDKVEPHNLPNQLHLCKAVGLEKVKSLAALCLQLAGAEIETMPEFWAPETDGRLEGIVISAMDHIRKNPEHPTAGREELWRALKVNTNVELLVDARIGGELIHIFCIRPVNDIFFWEWYERTLFAEKEIAPLPCTARSIIDVGFAVSAVITNLVRKFLKTGEVVPEVIMDMNSLTIMRPEVKR